MRILILSFILLLNFRLVAQEYQDIAPQGYGDALCESPENCCFDDVPIYHWKPEYGSIPRFAVQIALHNSNDSYLIILGKDKSGIWTIEGETADGSAIMYSSLCHIDTIGSKKEFNILKEEDRCYFSSYYEKEEIENIEKKILGNLWQMAEKKIYVTDSLIPVHFSTFQYKSREKIARREENYPGWFLKVKDKNYKITYYWNMTTEQQNCWCGYDIVNFIKKDD